MVLLWLLKELIENFYARHLIWYNIFFAEYSMRSVIQHFKGVKDFPRLRIGKSVYLLSIIL